MIIAYYLNHVITCSLRLIRPYAHGLDYNIMLYLLNTG